MKLTKDAIMAAQDLKREVVNVPEWGGDVIVSEMSGADFQRYCEASETDEASQKGYAFMALVLVFCLVDEGGVPLFSVEDAPKLARRKKSVLHRLFNVADRLNLLSRAAQQEAEKNFEGEDAGDVSSSPSPANLDSPPSATSSGS